MHTACSARFVRCFKISVVRAHRVAVSVYCGVVWSTDYKSMGKLSFVVVCMAMAMAVAVMAEADRTSSHRPPFRQPFRPLTALVCFVVLCVAVYRGTG